MFARHHTTLGPTGFSYPSVLNQPITIDPLPPLAEPRFPSVTVNPGDVLLCDIDGCVVIPSERVAEVAEAAKRRKVLDEKIREELMRGGKVGETMRRIRG